MATVDSVRATAARPSYAAAFDAALDQPAAAAHAAKAPIAGRIGPWQLVRLLHESDLARVYFARPADASDAAPAAYVLKVLRKEWWRDPHAIEMQRRAAWAGRKASHPHLLPVLASGVDQPPFYLVSPRLAGESLAEILKRQRRLPLALALWIARQTAEGLAALHNATRMIHADVKPTNVVVGPDGHATLIDLGFVHAPDEGRHWSSRPVYGTLNYLAPECLASSLGACLQSDLYSLGVMLYEMLAGVLPFAGRDAEHLIRQHREQTPEPLRLRRREVPDAAAHLVDRLLAKDPLRRPAAAEDVADQLVRLEIECFAVR